MSYLLQHLLIKSAQNHPDGKAVTFGKESLTYQELDTITNKAAHVLINSGVKNGDRVGIYINKSIPSVISIYAILKAGAVYVPLDSQAPQSRIAFIIDNCEIKCLLTSTAKAKSLPGILEQCKSLQVALITDDQNTVEPLPLDVISWDAINEEKEVSLPEVNSISNDLAYIIYTSGSTGNPKGVMISHLNSLTFVDWAGDNLDILPTDTLSSHAPLHFDLSIFDIFVGAKAGANVVLVPETLSMFPPRLASWIEENKITVWYSVPSILSMMVTHGQLPKRNFENLRKIIFAGEVFPVKYLRELMKIIPQAEYVNLYGPTETNVITYYITPPIPDEQTKPIPIGISCQNMQVFALTKQNELVTEPGQEGELLARGTCVAQGYWGDKVKTDKVFIDNPTQPNFRDQAYRTGDLVTLDEEGNYIYLGRIDHMIKSRGYRIEIGEIESAIYSHPQVKEAAVIAIPDDLITNRIKAIIVMTNAQEVEASDIRMFCSDKLPKYMIPEIIEFMEELPKTSTGKVDKTTLLKQAVDS